MMAVCRNTDTMKEQDVLSMSRSCFCCCDLGFRAQGGYLHIYTSKTRVKTTQQTMHHQPCDHDGVSTVPTTHCLRIMPPHHHHLRHHHHHRHPSFTSSSHVLSLPSTSPLLSASPFARSSIPSSIHLLILLIAALFILSETQLYIVNRQSSENKKPTK